MNPFRAHDPNASRLLRDAVTGDWVIIAPKRRFRPDGQKHSNDPFSPKLLPREEIIATYGRGKDVMTVIHNKFPVFHEHRDVRGHQEIIVEGEKVERFWDASFPRIVSLFEAITHRMVELRKYRTLKYIQVFKNEGPSAGASQMHPHSQIFAMSFVPDRLRDEAKRRRAALKKLRKTSHAHALHSATLALTVFSDDNVIAFTNETARFAYEVRIVTRRKIDNITQATPEERKSLAKAVYALLPLMKKMKCSYNFFFHDVIDEADEHFEIRFVPRINVWGGFELDAGIVVLPVPAEIAAQEYRNAN